MSEVNYPPEVIYKKPQFGKRNLENIILWMLANNKECLWSNFTGDPLNLSTSSLSTYFDMLKRNGYVDNYSRGHYRITPEGKKRFNFISTPQGEKRRLNYPPKAIANKRNYDDTILWMAYNNSSLKWSDFLNEPLNINSSSLSKNMNLLFGRGYIEKVNKEYRITNSGKIEYSRMLQNYDLDKQSILNEESKRIEDITKKTIQFFENYSIQNEDIQFRYLNNVLRLDYARVKGMLTDEEDFDKILLFLSMNHPNQYPKYISKEDFSKTYRIKLSKLEYYIDEIVENQIYPIKFFKLLLSHEEIYYFQENERVEIMLRAITEDHITKFTYLGKLFSKSLELRTTIDNILDDICGLLFNECFKEPLSEFLQEYISYLAYKIEAKTELRESYDKLEGIIWQDMIDIFQMQETDSEKGKLDEKIKEIDNEIKSDPENIELYVSKISILLYYEQLDNVLKLLGEMLVKFPEEEVDIMMKKASVLRRMRNVEGGLGIIDELIEKYPENSDLLNYKAYWLQYLNKKEESLSVIKELVETVPENGLYQDTYGEILMYFQKHDEAANKFIKVLDIASDEWYISQTYIKLGICYKELKNADLAVENLTKGKELIEESSIDLESKQKWLAIATLFLAEIEQLD